MKYWATSLALHGAAAGLAALVWLKPAARTEAEPLRWEVAFAPVAAPAPEAVPEAAPPARRQEAEPEPALQPHPAPEPVRAVERPPEPPPPPLAAPDPAPRPPEVAAPATPVVPVPVARVAAPPPASMPAPVAAEPAPPRPVAAATPSPASSRPPSPEPAPTPAADAAAEVERRWYLALLERLRAMKRYPMTARRLGQEGVVLIEARIGPDGQLQGATIKRGSGFPLLDRDALRLFEAAAADARERMQPERPTRLEIPIAYRLEG